MITPEQLTAFCAIAGLGLLMGGWFVTDVVRRVIREDFKKILDDIQHELTDLGNRVIVVETVLEIKKGKKHEVSN